VREPLVKSTVQVFAGLFISHPCHPPKPVPEAVSTTVAPSAKAKEHVPGQVIPAGALVTEPMAVLFPITLTESVAELQVVVP
jgi:hypothetical protein